MWGELDNAMRVSVIFGFAMGSFQLLLAFPLYQLWPAFLSPVVLVELVENPFSIIWIVIFAAVTLTPLFLLGATIALIIKPLSPESRGILGFLMIIVGLISTPFLFLCLALSSS